MYLGSPSNVYRWRVLGIDLGSNSNCTSTQIGFDLKKFVLLLILGVVSVFGVAASGGTALAANCSVAPGAPGALSTGMRFPATIQCTQVDQLQFTFFVYNGTDNVIWNTNQTQIFSLTLNGGCNSIFGCFEGIWGDVPGCLYGWYANISMYYLDQVKFRIHNAVTGTWGSWTAWSTGGPENWTYCGSTI